ncbi:unnamed protein product, partial [Brachionus calyciflorus]
FIPNRLGIPNSAISLSTGYYNLPPRNYFDGEFTLMAWTRLTKTAHFQRFIECGIDRFKAVIASLSDGYSNRPHYTIFYGNSESSLRVISANPLEIGVWYHLTFTFKNKIGYYYRNGVMDKFGELEYPINITRTVCFLGRSQYPESDPDASADFDDIKIFNKALNEDEILKEYQKNY